MFQFTHPRGVRQVYNLFQFMRYNVSIHAPARGATIVQSMILTILIVSIHAPARGATGFFISSLKTFYVSIHAPARGATIG